MLTLNQFVKFKLLGQRKDAWKEREGLRTQNANSSEVWFEDYIKQLWGLCSRTPHMFQATEFFAAEDITRVSPNLENEDGEGELRIDAQHAVVVREIDTWWVF
jgi:hypothetical protein